MARLWPGPWLYHATFKQVPNLSVLGILGERHLTFPLPNEGSKVDGFQGYEDPVASLRLWISFQVSSGFSIASLTCSIPSDTIGFLTHLSLICLMSGFPCHSRKAWVAACFHCEEYSERRQKLKSSVAPLWTSGNRETLPGKAIKLHLF